ncbi:hypothetical protein HDU99_008441, partial [Rhizoclosmatium hyalinum]
PNTIPVNSLKDFLAYQVTHVLTARVYRVEPAGTVKDPSFAQELQYNNISACFNTAKGRVMGLIMDSTDAALYTVFKNSAATQEDIVKGLAALEKYC